MSSSSNGAMAAGTPKVATTRKALHAVDSEVTRTGNPAKTIEKFFPSLPQQMKRALTCSAGIRLEVHQWQEEFEFVREKVRSSSTTIMGKESYVSWTA